MEQSSLSLKRPWHYHTDKKLSARDEWCKMVAPKLGKLSRLNKLIGSKEAKDYCSNLNQKEI